MIKITHKYSLLNNILCIICVQCCLCLNYWLRIFFPNFSPVMVNKWHRWFNEGMTTLYTHDIFLDIIMSLNLKKKPHPFRLRKILYYFG